MTRRSAAAASAKRVRAQASQAVGATLFALACLFGRSASAAELELRYYGAAWCAPCHQVEPMVERWAAEHPDLRVTKLDYDSHAADRERFGLFGVPMLVLMAGDKVVAKYGQSAQRVSDFADDRLEWWYESARGKIDAPQ